MNTLANDQREEDGSVLGDTDEDGRLPQRPRRRYLSNRSLVLSAAVACAAGFYAGVRVERGQLSGSNSSTGGATLSTLAARFRAGGAGPAAGVGATAAGAGAAATGAGAAAGRLGSAGGSFGTIASMSGRSLYLTDTTGNTIKVRLASTTKLTKSLGVSRTALHPGDTVVVRGVKNARGTLVAATVSDTGSGSGSGGPTGSGRGGGASSAVGSLFSAGG
jgi:Domain of unknown function (DUF5666)